jgi:Tol biopolymer transport system component
LIESPELDWLSMARRLKLRSLLLIASGALAVVLVAVTATAGAAAPAKWIVFSAVPPGQHIDQLFRIRSSGAGLKRVTRGQYPSIAPAFSPDGTRIAFARSGIGITTMNVDGTAVHRLTTNGRDSYPAWSPDGKQIAFVRPTTAAWSIFVMSSSGGHQRRLAKAPASGRPTWSSNGLMIPTGGDLVKIDPSNGHVLKFFGATIDAVWGLNTVSLAPDDSRLTFIGAAAPEPGDKECGDNQPCQRFALYQQTVLPKTKPPRLVKKNVGPATYSPDGKQLAFVSRNTKLEFLTLATGRSRTISIGGNYATAAAAPTWQP